MPKSWDLCTRALTVGLCAHKFPNNLRVSLNQLYAQFNSMLTVIQYVAALFDKAATGRKKLKTPESNNI